MPTQTDALLNLLSGASVWLAMKPRCNLSCGKESPPAVVRLAHGQLLNIEQARHLQRDAPVWRLWYAPTMIWERSGDAYYYSPGVCIGAEKEPVMGSPDPDHISMSYVERQNLTMRMHMRRFTRLTNAFSKKVENHMHMAALHFMAYNFIRIHSTLKCSPAMAAGVSERLWDVADIVTVVEEWEARQTIFGGRE